MIQLDQQFSANNYAPLPVILHKGEGIYLWDVEGKKYIDMMSAYSAVNHGHCHPKLISAMHKQAQTLAVTSRAFYTDTLEPFLQKACKLFGYEKALPMNTGAEAVETAIKAARKWGYQVKKVPDNKAEIIVCNNNFHGRTTTIISFSSEAQYKNGFGPFTPGFKLIPYGNVNALKQAITTNTVAFLVEPIQGEGGIIVPPDGYLKQCQQICRENKVLLICDEIQTGLGRTGKLLASMHEKVQPDGLILGKALGGGLYPVSLFLANNELMEVFTPGDHGSTFGGNPLAATIASVALDILIEDKLTENAERMGNYFIHELRKIKCSAMTAIRGKGLLIGVEFDANKISAREVCLQLMKNGLLSKEK